jgi:anaerobic magnesium-protoporphyrin IX monomethyl ester cyclase
MDILLVNPGKMDNWYLTENLGLASLESFLSAKNIRTDSLDMCIENLSIRETIRKILHINPAAVGVSLLDSTQKTGLKIIRELRDCGYQGKIIVGGYFPTFAAKEILRDFPQIDFVVKGEGELTLLELVRKILKKTTVPYNRILGLSFRHKGTIIENPARPLIKNLDILPPPCRKYAAQVLQSGSHLRVYASRGCWGRCSFCEIIGFYGISSGKSWRHRSVNLFVDELEHLQKSYHTDYFIFNDDQFLVKGRHGLEYVEEFAGEIERRNLKIKFELMCRADTINRTIMLRLKSVGLQRIFLGIESFDQAQLQRYNKGISVRENIKAIITLRKLKINVIVSIILADAYTTVSDLFRQLYTLIRLRQKFSKGKQFQISINNQLELYRGSRLLQKYADAGLLLTNNYSSTYRYKLNILIAVRLLLLTMLSKLNSIFHTILTFVREPIETDLNKQPVL